MYIWETLCSASKKSTRKELSPTHSRLPIPFVCLLLGISCISHAVLLCVNEGFAPLEALTDPPLISALHWQQYWFLIGPI